MKNVLRTSAILIFTSCIVFGQDRLPRVFLFDAATLAEARASYAGGKGTTSEAIAALLKEGEKALNEPLVSVMQKTQAPPSGDKHDYMSLAPYWWPDSSKPGGLPYIRRDGEVNPDRYTLGDRARIGAMVSSSTALAFSYFITGEERYALRAREVLRTWFLNPDTRMKPNLTYAQAVRGETEGRSFGIIDGQGFRNVVDAVGLLGGSKAWTSADQEGMKKWFERYLDWLMNSEPGKQEAAAKNNHGTTCAVQICSIALFLGKDDLAARVIQRAETERIARQIEPDGSQPFELVRTKSWNYSMLNLEALIQLAWMGDRVGVDLWHYTTTDGRSIRKAMEYLLPAAMGTATWKKAQITRMETERLYTVLRIAAVKYASKEYDAASRKLPGVRYRAERANVLFPAFHIGH